MIQVDFCIRYGNNDFFFPLFDFPGVQYADVTTCHHTIGSRIMEEPLIFKERVVIRESFYRLRFGNQDRFHNGDVGDCRQGFHGFPNRHVFIEIHSVPQMQAGFPGAGFEFAGIREKPGHAGCPDFFGCGIQCLVSYFDTSASCRDCLNIFRQLAEFNSHLPFFHISSRIRNNREVITGHFRHHVLLATH